MPNLAVIGAMIVAAFLPLSLMAYLVRAGANGLALTLVAIVGGVCAIFWFAAGRPYGVDPVLAMGVVMLLCVPALLGAAAGALLGWLLRRQDDRRVQ